MTPEELQAINHERLELWAGDLVKDHATALIVVGVGHDDEEGEIVVCMPNTPEMTKEVAAAFLRRAAEMIDGQTYVRLVRPIGPSYTRSGRRMRR